MQFAQSYILIALSKNIVFLQTLTNLELDIFSAVNVLVDINILKSIPIKEQ